MHAGSGYVRRDWAQKTGSVEENIASDLENQKIFLKYLSMKVLKTFLNERKKIIIEMKIDIYINQWSA